jgi:opacity protein-like surface antigen
MQHAELGTGLSFDQREGTMNDRNYGRTIGWAAFAFCWLVITASVAPSTASAQELDYARTGSYVGLGGTYAIEDFDVEGADNTLGLNLRVGYRFQPRLAGELEFEYYDDFGDFGVKVDGWALTANAKVYGATGQVQPFLLAGLGVVHGEASADGFESLENGDRHYFAIAK